MRKSHLLRGCAALSAVPLVLGALVVAAGPAAACSAANNTVDAGLYGRPLEASVGTAYSNSVVACVGTIGNDEMLIVVSAGSVHHATATFDCVNQTSGAIGDPSDPATYVPYRIGFDPAGPRVCAEASGVALSAGVNPGNALPWVYFTPQQDGYDQTCGGASETQAEAVVISAPGFYQEIGVGLGTPFGGSSDSDCGGAMGAFTCTYTGSPLGLLTFDEATCPDGYAANQTVAGLPAYALAFADETGATVLGIAGEAVTTVLTTADPVLAEVNRIVTPIVNEAWGAVGTVLGVVDDYVELGTTQGDCTVNVASAGDVAIMRSPTGQVPTSVCLVVGSAVTRVTIG